MNKILIRGTYTKKRIGIEFPHGWGDLFIVAIFTARLAFLNSEQILALFFLDISFHLVESGHRALD